MGVARVYWCSGAAGGGLGNFHVFVGAVETKFNCCGEGSWGIVIGGRVL